MIFFFKCIYPNTSIIYIKFHNYIFLKESKYIKDLSYNHNKNHLHNHSNFSWNIKKQRFCKSLIHFLANEVEWKFDLKIGWIFHKVISRFLDFNILYTSLIFFYTGNVINEVDCRTFGGKKSPCLEKEWGKYISLLKWLLITNFAWGKK